MYMHTYVQYLHPGDIFCIPDHWRGPTGEAEPGSTAAQKAQHYSYELTDPTERLEQHLRMWIVLSIGTCYFTMMLREEYKHISM